ncbi:hypothetical protein [Paraburkholderia youngii]|uniref:hypothetical protein n=1 Tax=Paraburkholderia youngii TaxID=2782701 RepID=UPI003D25DA62
MLTSAEFSGQSEVEREVRGALAAYKVRLVMTHHRNWWHRLGCWCGDAESVRIEEPLEAAEGRAWEIGGRSAEHASWV